MHIDRAVDKCKLKMEHVLAESKTVCFPKLWEIYIIHIFKAKVKLFFPFLSSSCQLIKMPSGRHGTLSIRYAVILMECGH